MGGNSGNELVLLDQAGQALAEANSLGEIKTIRDKAEAVRKYAQSASLGLDVQNRAAEVKLRAERQAGKLLSQLTLRGGDRRSKSHRDRLKLRDLGLTPNQSKRWQLQARVPENLFREHVRQTCECGKELTSAGLMRLAKRLRPAGRARTVTSHELARSHGSHQFRDGALSLHERASDSDFAEVVDELCNHHQVLDGILQQIYDGQHAALRPGEVRMLRYLMAETGNLLAQLSASTSSAPVPRFGSGRNAS